MSKIAINKERVIEHARIFGLELEYDSKAQKFYPKSKKDHFLRFKHYLAPKHDTRFAIIVYTSQDMDEAVDKHITLFHEALIDIGKWLKEQEIIKALNLQPKEDIAY